jgi:hypothetical protein
VDASAANCVGERPARRAIVKLASESGKADMNFGALKCREFGATKCIVRMIRSAVDLVRTEENIAPAEPTWTSVW